MTSPKQSKSRQALTAEQIQNKLNQIDKLKKEMPDEMHIPITHTSETTQEGLRNFLFEQNGRAAILAAEGGTQFEIIGGLYSKEANLDVFLNGHAADDIRVQRSSSKYVIPRPALTLGICVQPEVLAGFGEQNKKQFRGRGLLGRMMFVFPASNVGNRDVRGRVAIPRSVSGNYCDGIYTLLDESFRINKALDSEARVLTLAPDAKEAWLEEAAQLEASQRPGGKLAQISDWAGKAHGLMLRLAGLLHVARYQAQAAYTVDVGDVETAGNLINLLAEHMRVALDLIGNDAVVADAKYALEWIVQNAQQDDAGAWLFKRSGLFGTPRFKNSKVDRLKNALENLRERHIVSVRQTLATKKPTYVHYVNPAVMEVGVG